jgi:hypothetical protein
LQYPPSALREFGNHAVEQGVSAVVTSNGKRVFGSADFFQVAAIVDA